jgi:hypothetical protein
VSLDDRALSDDERVKLSDFEIDAAILQHREQLHEEIPARRLGRPGANDVSSSRQLSCSSSTASLSGLPVDSPHSEDSGSRLTHGTDIVFAGNVSSALRRHRYEAETESSRDLHNSTGSSEGTVSASNSRPPSSHGLLERPKTPARRVSITDTLDRAREFDTQKYTSRDAILDELKTWQLDSLGTSQLGVPRAADEVLYSEVDSSSTRGRSRRKGSVDGVKRDEAASAASRTRLERRPNTSAGVLRNGANVREAFVEMTVGSSGNPPRPISRGGLTRQRGSVSSTAGVDILILDGGEDRKRPCSPTKTPRGIFTTSSSGTAALGRHHEWNLEVLSPIVGIATAKRHLPSSLSRKQQLERSLARGSGKTEGEDDSSDSDADDE